MNSQYGLGEIFTNIIALMYTKIFYRKARLIRLPIYIRGKKMLSFGMGFTTGYGCRIEMFDLMQNNQKKIIIGDNCKIGDHVHLAAGENLTIGDNCLLASKIYISDISHGQYNLYCEDSRPETIPDKRPLFTNPVQIGNNVWIGENVSILPGVNIGNGSIIGANAVVNSNIPDHCIAVGVPAKVIKKYDQISGEWLKVNKDNLVQS